MKSSLALASLAALSAFSLQFVTFEVATSILVGAGFAAIVLHDYARTVDPRGTKKSLVRTAAPRGERLRLAA